MLKPDQLAKSGTEHGHQSALFAFVAVAHWHGFNAAKVWASGGDLPARDPDQPPALPCLKWFHAIHNQGHGDKIRGARAKAEGVKKGVADTFLPWPVYEPCPSDPQLMIVKWCGLYIEMKKPSEKPKRETSKGGVSDEQAEFGKFAKGAGYGWCVCYGWQEAAQMLENYINFKGG